MQGRYEGMYVGHLQKHGPVMKYIAAPNVEGYQMRPEIWDTHMHSILFGDTMVPNIE